MLKTKVGYSQNVDAFTCGKETAEMANFRNAKVGLLFTSCVMNQKAIVEGIRSVSKVPFVGCTSSAAICTNEGYFNAEAGYSGMMSFSGDVEVGVAASERTENETAREIGKRIAKEAMKSLTKKPAYFFMSASPKEEEAYMKGIMDVVGEIPVFGGSAADNTVEGKWSLICGEKIFSDGCVVALFAGDESMTNLYTGEYRETTDSGVITKVVNDRTLVEIDGQPAVKKYCKWTNKKEEDVAGGNLLAATIFDPLGVKDPIGSVTAVRHPMAANDDNSMNIGANLAVNTAVVRLHLEPQEMVQANPNAIEKLNGLIDGAVGSYFLVHCGGRRLGLQLEKLEDQIYPTVKKACGDREFLMVFTFGEYGHSDHSSNVVGGLSLSFTGFKK